MYFSYYVYFYFISVILFDGFLLCVYNLFVFFFSSRRRHTRYIGDWSSDVCSSDLVSSRIQRVGKNCEDVVIDRQLPHQAALASLAMENRQSDLLAAVPQQNLSRASEFSHFTKHEMKAFLNPAIWVHFDLAVLRPAEADGKTKLQFATPGLLAHRLQRSLSQQTQFERRHLSFHAQKQAVIHQIRIVDPNLVNDRLLLDRKSTRLNSSHRCISYAVFCLKKKNTHTTD